MWAALVAAAAAASAVARGGELLTSNAGGRSPFVLTREEGQEWDERRMMVMFDQGCLARQGARQADKVPVIHGYLGDCVQHRGRFHEVTAKGFTFFDVQCEDLEQRYEHQVAVDYEGHCIEHFLYQPVMRPGFDPVAKYSCGSMSTMGADGPVPDGDDVWGLDVVDGGPQAGGFDFSYRYVDAQQDNGVDVIVLDSGVLASHDEFTAGQVSHQQGDGPTTRGALIGSHGTHVAGTAAGAHYGVAKGFNILDYRVCEYNSLDEVTCPWDLITAALQDVLDTYTASDRRGVINMSLGGSLSAVMSATYTDYFDQLQAQGVLVVTSAGNNNADACNYQPAFAANAITVGAYERDLKATYFTNYGDCVDIWAPGQDITSAVADTDSSYDSYQGTSMASPHVAGLVANMLWLDPTLTFAEVQAQLASDTFEIDGYGDDWWGCNSRGHCQWYGTDNCDTAGVACPAVTYGCETPTNYVFVEGPLTQPQAEQYCQDNYAGHLASIHSAAEDAAAKVACATDKCWIGLDISARTWTDGTAVDYEGNIAQSGDGSCMELYTGEPSVWNDLSCTAHQRAMLCEPGVLECACESAFTLGDRVVAPDGAQSLVPSGATGTVVCASTGWPPLLVQWDGFSSGHDGNGYCDCGVAPADGTVDNYYVNCDEVEFAGREPLECACESAFAVGDRVVAPNGAQGLVPSGAIGTVVCASNGSPPLLVEWDGFTSGHDGNGYCDCGEAPADGTVDNYYVNCDEVEFASAAAGVLDGEPEGAGASVAAAAAAAGEPTPWALLAVAALAVGALAVVGVRRWRGAGGKDREQLTVAPQASYGA